MAIERWRPRWSMARRPGRDPFDEFFGRFFEDWFSPRASGEVRGWAPAIDMVDRKDEIVLRADLPGLERNDVDVSVENGVLTIRGERRGEEQAHEDDYYCCERWAGSFTRSMTLPQGADANQIKATFKNGVLEVHIPKTAQAVGRKIEIKAA